MVWAAHGAKYRTHRGRCRRGRQRKVLGPLPRAVLLDPRFLLIAYRVGIDRRGVGVRRCRGHRRLSALVASGGFGLRWRLARNHRDTDPNGEGGERPASAVHASHAHSTTSEQTARRRLGVRRRPYRRQGGARSGTRRCRESIVLRARAAYPALTAASVVLQHPVGDANQATVACVLVARPLGGAATPLRTHDAFRSRLWGSSRGDRLRSWARSPPLEAAHRGRAREAEPRPVRARAQQVAKERYAVKVDTAALIAPH